MSCGTFKMSKNVFVLSGTWADVNHTCWSLGQPPGRETSFVIPLPVCHVHYRVSPQSRHSRSRVSGFQSWFHNHWNCLLRRPGMHQFSINKDGRCIWGDPRITVKRHQFQASYQGSESHENRLHCFQNYRLQTLHRDNSSFCDD